MEKKENKHFSSFKKTLIAWFLKPNLQLISSIEIVYIMIIFINKWKISKVFYSAIFKLPLNYFCLGRYFARLLPKQYYFNLFFFIHNWVKQIQAVIFFLKLHYPFFLTSSFEKLAKEMYVSSCFFGFMIDKFFNYSMIW